MAGTEEKTVCDEEQRQQGGYSPAPLTRRRKQCATAGFEEQRQQGGYSPAPLTRSVRTRSVIPLRLTTHLAIITPSAPPFPPLHPFLSPALIP